MEESKLDKVLSAVITIQGQVTILQGQIKTVREQMVTKQELDIRFGKFEDKIDTRLGNIEKSILKLPCIRLKNRMKKFVSKPS